MKCVLEPGRGVLNLSRRPPTCCRGVPIWPAELARAHESAQREGVLPKPELAALEQCVEALVGGNGRALRRDARGFVASAEVASALGDARLGPRDLEVAPGGSFSGGGDDGELFGGEDESSEPNGTRDA